MKKILYVEEFVYGDTWVGTEIPKEIISSLINHDYDLTILCSSQSYHNKVLPDYPICFSKSFKVVYALQFPYGKNKIIFRLINSFLFCLQYLYIIYSDHYQLVITQSNPSILPIFVALSKFCNQFKWLFIVQDLYPDVIFAYLPKFYLNYIAFPFRTIYKFFFSSCTHFVVLGESMKYRLNNYNVPDNKISIISNWALGLDKSLENIKEPILSSSNLSKSCNFIYTGNVGSAHDSAFISKVIRYSHHLPVFFEFAASGSALNQLKHNLANIHHPRNFEFTNFIPSSNYNEYLARFHFGIVSMSKSFSGIVYPSKFFGYLSRGLPILYLGSDEELCTLIHQYNIGLVLNEINIHLFPEILAALTEESLATMRANCRELYQSKFSKYQSLSSYLRLVARI